VNGKEQKSDVRHRTSEVTVGYLISDV